MGKFVQPQDYTPDHLITPHLVALAGCVEKKLTESKIATCYGGVITGDDIDTTAIGESGAMWWVRLANVVVQAPGASGGENGTVQCTPVFVVAATVGYATCYPINDNGESISTDQHAMLSSLVNAAMMALYRGIACCDWAKGNTGLGDVTAVSWTPSGPDGGVMGGEWLVQFQVLRARPPASA